MAGVCSLSLQAQVAADSLQQEAKQEHVELLGISLSSLPQDMVKALTDNGLYMECTDSAKRTYHMAGMLDEMDLTAEVHYTKDSTHINLVKLSSLPGTNQKEEYASMLRWLRQEYGNPDWHGTVRSHHFCRWFVDFDRDIILIATGKGTVEVWLYENHQQRNIDYYSILKYCEKNPADDVPFLTANESITWKRNDSTAVRRHVATRHKKRAATKRRTAAKRRKATRSSARKKAKRR